ncbi:hypothetical protein KKF38_03690, partial [Patescibacteria group bacterium]|nr:hypothetical protein [Patescibacteria group bacterium]
MNFYKMEGGEWSGTTTPATTANIQPLEGLLVNNTNDNTVHIYLDYEDSNPGEQFFTKMLDVGWNIVGVADLSFEADSEDYTEISVKNAFSSIKDQPSNIIDYTTDDFGGNDNSNEIDFSSQRYSTPETDTEKFEEFKAYPVFVRQAVKYSGSSTNKPTSPVEINGSLTVTKSSTPVSDTVVKGAQDVPLIGLTMAAGSAFDVKVTKMVVRIRADDDTVFNADQIAASDYINNIELWVGDVKIAGPGGLTLVGSVADGYYKATFDNMDYTITAGETIQVIVKGDISSDIPSIIYVAADIDPNSDDITCEDSNGDEIIATGASSINNSTSPNPVITVLSSVGTLTVTKSSTPVSDTAVKGTQNVSLIGLTMAAGAASDVQISEMVVRLYANDNTDFNDGGTASSAGGAGGISANDYVSNIELWVGDTKIAGPEGMSLVGTITGTGYYKATFDNMDYTVDAGSTIQIVVKGDLSSNVSSTTYLTADIDPDNDITAEDVGGNSVTAGGTNNLNLATNPNPVLTVSTGGSLTIAVDADTAKENIVVAGTSDVVTSKFKFTTTDEVFIVKKLSINNRYGSTVGDYDNNIVSVKLSYTNSTGTTETKTGYLTSGTANFSGLDMLIDKDDDAVLTVFATLNTIAAGATAAEFVDLNVAFNDFEAVAQGSGETYTGAKIDSGVAATSDLDFGSITWTDSGATSTTTTVSAAGSTQALTISAAKYLPVGTLLLIDEADTGTYTAGTDFIFVLTSTLSTTSAVTKVLDDGDLLATTGLKIYYALPGDGYLTQANQMVVYESKPTVALSSSSPSGSRTTSASDGIFIFTISADAQEKIQFRAGVELTDAVDGVGAFCGAAPAADTTAGDHVDASGELCTVAAAP